MHSIFHFLQMYANFQRSDAIIEQNGIEYYLNFNKKTASIIGNKIDEDDIFIPRSIKYLSSEHLITNILEYSFAESTIKLVEFAPDSAILTIEKNAFVESKIENIKIPSSLTKIDKLTFYNCEYLQGKKTLMKLKTFCILRRLNLSV